MEIRLVERYETGKSKGRVKNVEIYSEGDFFLMLRAVVYEMKEHTTFWERLSKNIFKLVGEHLEGRLRFIFVERLMTNKNRK